MQKLSALWAAFRLAFDSLVRTYTPQILATLAGLLVSAGIPVTDELRAFIGLLVAFVFFVVWYLLNRLYEVLSGKVSKLLTFGLVKTKPTGYAVHAVKELTVAEAGAIAAKQVDEDQA
ncbi:MAG: hypothetical protein KGL39_23075 [Patescibacteria group bacterium]|nr:hypothetical protein [Patescibacteria group bacterium]